MFWYRRAFDLAVTGPEAEGDSQPLACTVVVIRKTIDRRTWGSRNNNEGFFFFFCSPRVHTTRSWRILRALVRNFAHAQRSASTRPSPKIVDFIHRLNTTDVNTVNSFCPKTYRETAVVVSQTVQRVFSDRLWNL